MAYFKDTGRLVSETTPPVLTSIIWGSLGLVAVAAVGTGLYWFTAPAYVAIQNRTFHESQAYNDGMARDLDNMRLAYLSADAGAKAAIRATIQHRFAGYDADRLPLDLQAFLAEMRS